MPKQHRQTRQRNCYNPVKPELARDGPLIRLGGEVEEAHAEDCLLGLVSDKLLYVERGVDGRR